MMIPVCLRILVSFFGGKDMDSPIIAAYYKETDPMKRLKLLNKSVEKGEDPEGNAIRKEIWEIRYAEKSAASKTTRADGFLGLWMTMEFNRYSAGKYFGRKGAVKELNKWLEKLKFDEFQDDGNPLKKELFYRECVHMVYTYVMLSKEDKNYNSYLFGFLRMKKESAEEKMKKDIYDTGIELPEKLGIEKMKIIAEAAREIYDREFKEEDYIDEL